MCLATASINHHFMRLLYFILFCLPVYTAQAQVVDTIYFSSNGEVTTKGNTFFYSVINRKEADTTVYLVETFFRSGGLMQRGAYRARHFPVAWHRLHQPDFLDALKDGLFREYHESGQLKFEGAFKDGRGTGIHRRWYEGGQLLSEGTLVEGRFEGKVASYHENGQKKVDYPTKNGLADGELIEYHADGRKKEKSTYRNGEKTGATVRYDADGNEILQ